MISKQPSYCDHILMNLKVEAYLRLWTWKSNKITNQLPIVWHQQTMNLKILVHPYEWHKIVLGELQEYQ